MTYRTGGSPESLTAETGMIVEQGDVEGLLDAVRKFAEVPKEQITKVCREHAEANFDKRDRYADYINLYHDILNYENNH